MKESGGYFERTEFSLCERQYDSGGGTAKNGKKKPDKCRKNRRQLRFYTQIYIQTKKKKG
ncbi:MAG: hypothetical protein U0U46_11140 [Saprospiraceae bacterium]